MPTPTTLQVWVREEGEDESASVAYTVTSSGEFQLDGLTPGQVYLISVPPFYLAERFVAGADPELTDPEPSTP